MRLVIQRVTEATLSAEDGHSAAIGKGLLILVGITYKDTVEQAIKLAEKVFKIRLMADQAGKMNLSVNDAEGEFLVVSQFTLYSDTTGGNRPSFIQAARPEIAKPIYEAFTKRLKDLGATVSTGSFGNYMEIKPILDGPVTIIVDN